MVVISFLILQACQLKNEEKEVLVKKRAEARNYNIQLGMVYLRQNNQVRAKHKLLKALKLSPNSPKANSAFAYYLEKTGEASTANIYYQKALSLAPKSGSELNNYGTFLCRQGDYIRAEKYFLKAVQDVHYLNTAAVYENAGLCAAANKDETKAEKYFIKALSEDSRRKQALYELAALKLQQNLAMEALKYLENYSELTFSDVELLSLGVKAAALAKQRNKENEFKNNINRLTNSGVNYEHDKRG